MKLSAILRSMRPAQWTKNFVVFAALVFAQKFFSLPLLLKSLAAFLVFCLVSGGLYIFNDLRDREEDRAHPKKSHRPIARGEVSSSAALAAFLVLETGSLAAAFFLNRNFFIAVLVYMALQL